MKVKFSIGILLIISLGAFGQDHWKVDSTRIVFHISNAGFTVDGSVAGVEAGIRFSKSKFGKSSFIATVQSATIYTGIQLRDKHLKKTYYFDVTKYPTMEIASKRIVQTAEGFEALSVITIKGTSKEVNIPFTFSQTNNSAEFKGSLSLNRLDFGVGGKSIILSEKVDVDIWISATRQ